MCLKRIDELATELLVNAERKCRKFRTGEVEYSLETNAAIKTWHLQILILRHELSMKNYFTMLLSLSNDFNIDEFYSITIEKVKQNIASSRMFWRKLKCLAVSRRTKH